MQVDTALRALARRYELWPRLAREELAREQTRRREAVAHSAAPESSAPAPAASAPVAGAADAGDDTAGWIRFFLTNKISPGPQLWWTDSCCKEREFLMGIFTSLKGDRVYDPSIFTPAGLMPMTPILISLVDNSELANAACQALSQSAVLGFDIEWPPSCVLEDGRGRVATIQLASEMHAYVFQLRKLVVDAALPQPLAEILANESIKKVGVNCAGDATLLLKDYQAVVAGLLDIASVRSCTQLIARRPCCPCASCSSSKAA